MPSLSRRAKVAATMFCVVTSRWVGVRERLERMLALRSCVAGRGAVLPAPGTIVFTRTGAISSARVHQAENGGVRRGQCRRSWCRFPRRQSAEDINVGDKVLATDPVRGETAAKTVVGTITTQGRKNLVELTVDTDGTAGDKTGTILATAAHPIWAPEMRRWPTASAVQADEELRDARGGATGSIAATDRHPFWVVDTGEWAEARNLKPGDEVRTLESERLPVLKTRRYTAMRRVHNLTVAGIHTFFVLAGEAPVLVHNCNLYDGPGWQHVLEDHVPGSRGVIGDPDATLFHVPGGLRGADYVDTIGDYIEETVERGTRRANTPDASGRRDGDVYEMAFDYQVGARQDGKSLYNVRVVLNPSGSIRTAFPF